MAAECHSAAASGVPAPFQSWKGVLLVAAFRSVRAATTCHVSVLQLVCVAQHQASEPSNFTPARTTRHMTIVGAWRLLCYCCLVSC